MPIMTQENTLSRLEVEAIRAAMRKMFHPNSYFDICTVDQCLKVAKIVPPRREYEAVCVLHCVSWRDMSPELRHEVAKTVLGFFEQEMFDPMAVELLLTPEVRVEGKKSEGIFARLIGGKH